MNVKTAVVFAVAAVAVNAALMPAFVAAQTNGADSRADLYRRNLLAGKDVPCRTNASCAALGVAALEAGRIKEAQTLVTMEAALADATAMQADEENSPKATSSARARVAMALVHQGDVQLKLGAFPDARAYYRTAVSRGNDYPDDALLGRAVAAARQRLEAIAGKEVVAGLPPNGARFASYKFFGSWNSIEVKPVKGRHGVYRIDGDFVYPTVGADGQASANMGNLSAYVRFYDGVARVSMTDDGGDAPLDATARITSLAPYDKPDDKNAGKHEGEHGDKCLIEFKLSAPETLDVKTHGSLTECGFGFNVTADGRYYLMTSP
jgi:hypothetical protein